MKNIKSFVAADSVVEVLPIGTKGMFTDSNNNFIFNLGGSYFAIDFGLSFNRLSKLAGIKPTDIDFCVVSHADADHKQINALLGQTYWIFDETGHNPHRPVVYTTKEQSNWLRNMEMAPVFDAQGLTVEDYCEFVVADNNEFDVNGYTVEIIDTTDLHVKGMQSYAYLIIHNESGKNVLYTSDIKNLADSGLKEKINSKTVAIFQDCHASGDPVHAGFSEILAYYPEEYHHLLQLMHLTGDFAPHKDIIEKKGIKFTVEGEWLSFK